MHKIKELFQKNSLIAYLFLLPWLIGFFGLVLGPMVSSLYLSFTQFDLLNPPKWVGFLNYENMFQDSRYWDSVKVTVTFVVIAVPTQLIAALAVAMLLNKGMRGVGIYRTVYYIPSLLGGSVAIALLWKNIFGMDGLVNSFLSFFNLQGQGWVSHPDYALYTLILLATWQFGASMVIFLAGLKQIPNELYEAASVDGASSFRKFFNITLPLLTPVLFFNLIIELIKSFQVFTSSFIISEGTGGPINSTLFYTLYLYQRGFSYFDMGYASAMAWMLVIMLGAMSLVIFISSKYWVFYEDGGKT
ncbi:carbohydrate ABC transporter permease [Alkalihalobacillus trypoxylicola]|uniref:ABC transporter permease n=1 Tax=Alkalihalobacillus trypoxylicola TaxID=519424 RepID=A0A162EML9_9BACI|nr:sugar ABC transporter permease [Alkalihalobacillus trypoxylicola]KYG33267.1 ABC transporter permease [Alkalihalobacillus trypoxylicola]GAF66553.1 ABC transporter permease protein [Bacillus sp. TS-2]